MILVQALYGRAASEHYRACSDASGCMPGDRLLPIELCLVGLAYRRLQPSQSSPPNLDDLLLLLVLDLGLALTTCLFVERYAPDLSSKATRTHLDPICSGPVALEIALSNS